MPDAICNTSPLLYLYRIGALDWLQRLFGEVWIPNAVASELDRGRQKGYDVPDLEDCDWLHRVEPSLTPPEWLALDLRPGELAAMALALENPDRIVLLTTRWPGALHRLRG
jgi:predicted nucleic acid-binding protein